MVMLEAVFGPLAYRSTSRSWNSQIAAVMNEYYLVFRYESSTSRNRRKIYYPNGTHPYWDSEGSTEIYWIHETGGWLRLRPKKHAQLVVTKGEYEISLNAAETGDLPYHSLRFRESILVYLHGRHCFMVISEHLDPLEQWWIVEL